MSPWPSKQVLVRWSAIGFFMVAGVNHFIHPEFYLPLIPDVLPMKPGINVLIGFMELVFGMGLINPSTRRTAAIVLVALLILLSWSHIYFIQIGSCVPDGLCIAPWIAWVRLVVIQPLFVWWVWAARR